MLSFSPPREQHLGGGGGRGRAPPLSPAGLLLPGGGSPAASLPVPPQVRLAEEIAAARRALAALTADLAAVQAENDRLGGELAAAQATNVDLQVEVAAAADERRAAEARLAGVQKDAADVADAVAVLEAVRGARWGLAAFGVVGAHHCGAGDLRIPREPLATRAALSPHICASTLLHPNPMLQEAAALRAQLGDARAAHAEEERRAAEALAALEEAARDTEAGAAVREDDVKKQIGAAQVELQQLQGRAGALRDAIAQQEAVASAVAELKTQLQGARCDGVGCGGGVGAA